MSIKDNLDAIHQRPKISATNSEEQIIFIKKGFENLMSGIELMTIPEGYKRQVLDSVAFSFELAVKAVKQQYLAFFKNGIYTTHCEMCDQPTQQIFQGVDVDDMMNILELSFCLVCQSQNSQTLESAYRKYHGALFNE